MNIGLAMFATSYSVSVAHLAQTVEGLGFESLWMSEHPILPVNAATPLPRSEDGVIPDVYAHIVDPFVALSIAATLTTKLKLATGVCLIPEREPLVTAKMVATLDHYCGGRFLFGIGAGWLKEETEAFGLPFEKRWAITKERVLAMKELWTKEEAEFHGRYVNFGPLKSFPKPATKPHPPVLIGGLGDRTLHRVAQWGDGWCPLAQNPEKLKPRIATLKELAKKAGRDPEKLDISVWLFTEKEGPDIERLKAYAGIGVGRAILHIPTLMPDEADAVLSTIAQRAGVRAGR